MSFMKHSMLSGRSEELALISFLSFSHSCCSRTSAREVLDQDVVEGLPAQLGVEGRGQDLREEAAVEESFILGAQMDTWYPEWPTSTNTTLRGFSSAAGRRPSEGNGLTEMTQSATGFFSALSAVSFSLVSSMPVTCSMLNTLSSSMYMI
ncbi:hypothetical protein EYF80_042537 [Liparis tanakae]|uniref:Uncharacterized protein n=1 Tax=Liparis tanakae TaxID=230148 RepID=A0A4Z2G1Z1_9TELE|nr:hypothetical protein EYF80_042537 [Liparis tanakae]